MEAVSSFFQPLKVHETLNHDFDLFLPYLHTVLQLRQTLVPQIWTVRYIQITELIKLI